MRYIFTIEVEVDNIEAMKRLKENLNNHKNQPNLDWQVLTIKVEEIKQANKP